MPSPTRAEMYNRLKNLEKKITNKKKEVAAFRNEYTRASYPPVLINTFQRNKTTAPPLSRHRNAANRLTPNVWRNFIRRGIKLVYDEYNPLVQKYMNLTNKYRNKLGLPAINRMYPPTNQLPFKFKKATGNETIPRYNNANLLRILRGYGSFNRPHGVQIAYGGGGGFTNVTPFAIMLRLTPDRELLNMLKPERNRRNTAILASLRRIGLANVGKKLVHNVRRSG